MNEKFSAQLQADQDAEQFYKYETYDDVSRPKKLENSPVALNLVPLESAHKDWPQAIFLVERAATTIKEYERKFAEIERDARSFMRRVDEEHAALNMEIEELRNALFNAEVRSVKAQESFEAAKIANWEDKIARRKLETKLDEAEKELRRSASYIKRVEELLGGI